MSVPKGICENGYFLLCFILKIEVHTHVCIYIYIRHQILKCSSEHIIFKLHILQRLSTFVDMFILVQEAIAYPIALLLS